jgi:hypothetical protein
VTLQDDTGLHHRYFIAQNRGFASGFDTKVNQEAQNVICSHPGNNATCNQEAVVSAPAASTTPSTPHKTCEQCFTVILSPEQLTKVADYNLLLATLNSTAT